MNRLLTIGWAIVVIAMIIGCSRGRDTRADVQAIQDTEKQWNQDYAARDPDKLATYYADNAAVMSPGTSPAVGRDSIRAALKQMVADPALSLHFTAAKIEVADSGDLGYTRGAYVLTRTDPQTKKIIHDRGSYVTTYRRDAAGKWKAIAEIASSELSPGQTSAM